MKSIKIKEKIETLKTALIKEIKADYDKAVLISGRKQSDLSRFVNNPESWTYNKILDIAEKFGL